jgi:hypothetical protein
MLLMYGISAIQMAHTKWFAMKSTVTETSMAVPQGISDGRSLTREVMANSGIRGEIQSVEETARGFKVRIVAPGTVWDVGYDRDAGSATVRTSVAGFMGMLNRLHHAAGLWHEHIPLKLWAVLVGVVSLATIGLAGTGIAMWWMRRRERFWGAILFAANLAFSLTVLALLRFVGC